MALALNGVEGAYLMMPPIQTPSPDFREAKAVVASYKEALAKSAPPKLVALSSMGSEKTSGLGLITSTHLLEEGLRNEPFPVAFVRAGSFYENYLFGLQAAQGGTLPIFYAPTERKLPMVATEDIGAEVAKLLTSEWTGKRVIELGSMVSSDELAAELGVVLGRDVKAQAIPREGWAAARPSAAEAEAHHSRPRLRLRSTARAIQEARYRTDCAVSEEQQTAAL